MGVAKGVRLVRTNPPPRGASNDDEVTVVGIGQNNGDLLAIFGLVNLYSLM